MALDQGQVNDLAQKINVEMGKHPKFALAVQNILYGTKKPQEATPGRIVEQTDFITILRDEMKDPDFLNKLRKTGMANLPPASDDTTSAPASAASSPTVTTTPPPVTATASAGTGNVLTPTQHSLVDRFNSGIAQDHKARQTYDAFISIVRGGDDRVHKKALPLKLDIQAEQQRAQAAGETFPADAFIAAMAVPATPTPTVTTTTTTATATGATPATTTPPVTATTGAAAIPPPPPIPPAPPAGAPVPPPPPPATPATGATKHEVTLGGMVIGLIVMFFLGWLCLEHIFPFVAKAMVRGGNEEQIEQLTSQLKSCNEQVQLLASARDQANNLRRDAEKELKESRANVAQLENQIATSDAGKLKAQLEATRRELIASTAAVDSWRPAFRALNQQSEEAGLAAKRKAEECNAQILALRERLEHSQDEVVRLDTLSRQLQDPNNVGVPIDADLLSFHLDPEVRCEVRIKRWGELQFQCFTLPGAGAGRIGTSPRIYRTTSGAHLYEVWCNGTKTFEKQVVFAPGERTKWARVSGKDWITVERTRPFLLLTGAGSEAVSIDPDVHLSVRR